MTRAAVLLLFGAAACVGPRAASAQSVITSQPLPPPAGLAAPPPPARLGKPVVAAPHKVPVVRPLHPPVKKLVAHKPPPPKPVARPVAKPVAATTPPVAPAPKPDPNKGTITGLPLPRWASLRSDDVNLRSGPGTQYPIDWVYHRRDFPVRILREFEVWRLIEEQDGTKGWAHEATLAGRRGYVVQGGEQVLRVNPDEAAAAVARLEAGVVGLVNRCPAASDWCEVQAGSYHGWLKRATVYGVTATEVIP